ncbi:hypothetical protein [Cohnella terricola]|uniref:hypothetical protein n=1 Tax=Cohnella terricola TaxID=1289167 RepID=UPI001647234E|nr:hypothetical protein [Cohnella terricola]
MVQPRYSLATLDPEELEEIRKMEQRMSDKAGHTISLIAYEAHEANDSSDS